MYYQIGCFQSCGTCSYTGKTLYPAPEDLVNAGCAVPPAPTLGGGDAAAEHALRTYNIDNSSLLGDWTTWNPWRSPGTAGKGNPDFKPCGVNSGSKPPFPDPPAGGQPAGADGTLLPPLPSSMESTWKAGAVVNATWSIYANHGGGYSYRLCKHNAAGSPVTEACFQQTPLEFASPFTTARFTLANPAKPDIVFRATTTSVGTFPEGSQWRKNPIPMCNCDIGEGCSAKQGSARVRAEHEALSFHKLELAGYSAPLWVKSGEQGGKGCSAVLPAQCGTKVGVNTCLKCGTASSYDCKKVSVVLLTVTSRANSAHTLTRPPPLTSSTRNRTARSAAPA